jgi:hypothetical protein
MIASIHWDNAMRGGGISERSALRRMSAMMVHLVMRQSS